MISLRKLEYKDDGTTLEGCLGFDDAVKAKTPGVLVIHDWMGVGPYVEKRVRQLVELGYTALAADIYGKGVRPANVEEAANIATTYKADRPLMRSRARAGLRALQDQSGVDTKRLAAIGYCFGGTAVLELARSGADMAGFVTFHGGLQTPTPDDAGNIRGKVLVLHGADDPLVPPGEVLAFEEEMRKARVDWHMVIYGSAVHSFSNPAAGDDPSRGAAYNEKADKRSWEAMKSFFQEVFAQGS
jgi:dienelactone hydrolase